MLICGATVSYNFMFFWQSLDYDKCINEPYLEVLETLDNKVCKATAIIPFFLVTITFSEAGKDLGKNKFKRLTF